MGPGNEIGSLCRARGRAGRRTLPNLLAEDRQRLADELQAAHVERVHLLQLWNTSSGVVGTNSLRLEEPSRAALRCAWSSSGGSDALRQGGDSRREEPRTSSMERMVSLRSGPFSSSMSKGMPTPGSGVRISLRETTRRVACESR